MAIARDTHATVTSAGTVSTQTTSYTVGATANTFLAFVFDNNNGTGNNNTVTGVTYNGVSMTQLQKVNQSLCVGYSYYLFIANPDGAAHDLVVSFNTPDTADGQIASWNGVVQSGLDASTNRTDTGTSKTDSITSVADNCWAIELLDSVDGTWTAGTGSNTVGNNSHRAIFDSNGVIHPAGSYSMSFTLSASSHINLRSQLTIAPVTATAPTVTTSAASSISTTSATGNGNVTDDGGSTITERGVCWSISANPTTSDSKTTASGTTGSYTASMSPLVPGVTYHYRAYAINAIGTSYGADTQFTTLTRQGSFFLIL